MDSLGIRTWALTAVIGACLLASGCERPMLDQRYVYYPAPWESRDWKALSGLPLEDVWLTTGDGVRISGWYVDAPQRQAVLLWCHGNAGTIANRLDQAIELHRRGLAVFMLDYRGYGRSDGRPSEDGLYQDALAAYDYLTHQRHIEPSRIVLFGQSLGAAVVGELARQRPAAGLILEAPFTSILDVGSRMAPRAAVALFIRARFDLCRRMPRISMPVLVLHGDRDTIIPFAMGEAVFAAANEPKRFFRIPGADHNDTYIVGGQAYFDAFTGFIRRVTTRPAP